MSDLRSRAMLAKLVGFATVSRDSNLALIEHVLDYLHVLGVDCELIYNDERTKANLAFSYDEEVGCLGVRSLLEVLPQRIPAPALCLIGEPTELKPVLGHKGKLAMRCHVRGAACHSAYAPYGINAIEQAARLIGRLGEIGTRLAEPQQHDACPDPCVAVYRPRKSGHAYWPLRSPFGQPHTVNRLGCQQESALDCR